ncbi:MAG: metallophosphatase family protein [Gammaproteobacteria bacterium]|nr:metallophosphatase family protein [Gammaproteobacteria bacterium]
MTFRIGIISDTHSSTAPLAEALQIFHSRQVDMIICAGDIAGYGEDELEQTVRLLKDNHCHVISGNHDDILDASQASLNSGELYDFFTSLPKYLTFEIAGKKIYVVHASPPDHQHGGIKLLDQNGGIISQQKELWQSELADFDYDILIVGHTHQVFAEYINSTFVINPGSTLYNNSCMILTLPETTLTSYPLQNKDIVKSWNWGLFFKGHH